MKRLPLIAFLMIIATGSVVTLARSSRWDELARDRKAGYLLFEGLSREYDDQQDAAFDFIGHAFETNPRDPYLGLEFASQLIESNDLDSTKIALMMALLGNYVNDSPDDYYGAMLYSNIAGYLGMNDTSIMVLDRLRHYHRDNPAVTYALVNALVQSRDEANMRRASVLYDTIYAASGKSPDVFLEKMKLLYALDDTTTMLDLTRRLLDTPGGNRKENYMVAGEVYEALRRNDLAIDNFRKAAECDTTDGMVAYRIAAFYHDNGDSTAYNREISRVLTSTSLEPEMVENLLRDYIATNIDDSLAWDRIDDVCRRVVTVNPHVPGLRNLYSQFLTFIDRPADAADQLQYSLYIEPDQLSQWQWLVQTYGALKLNDKATETVNDALRYFPENSSLYFMRAAASATDEDYDKAITDLRRAIEVDDSTNVEFSSSIHCTLGDLLYREGKVDEAFAEYDVALKLDPRNAYALNNYAYSLACRQERLDEALSMIELSLDIEPESVNAIDTYAWVLFQSKEYKKAREVYDAHIDLLLAEPNASADAFEHAGDIYFMTGDADKAVEFWQKGLALDPDSELLKRKVTHKTYFVK